MNDLLVANDFQVPAVLETENFRLRMLTVNDLVKDYEAVMSSVNHLQGLFGEKSKWPSDQLTLEQDLIDLGWHQKEFQRRSSFAYTVMTLDEKKCLGCVYIYPSTASDIDADVYLWARESELVSGLEEKLFHSVKSWIDGRWPFSTVSYPGRDQVTGDRN
jgi:hypothetical protein